MEENHCLCVFSSFQNVSLLVHDKSGMLIVPIPHVSSSELWITYRGPTVCQAYFTYFISLKFLQLYEQILFFPFCRKGSLSLSDFIVVQMAPVWKWQNWTTNPDLSKSKTYVLLYPRDVEVSIQDSQPLPFKVNERKLLSRQWLSAFRRGI